MIETKKFWCRQKSHFNSFFYHTLILTKGDDAYLVGSIIIIRWYCCLSGIDFYDMAQFIIVEMFVTDTPGMVAKKLLKS